MSQNQNYLAVIKVVGVGSGGVNAVFKTSNPGCPHQQDRAPRL